MVKFKESIGIEREYSDGGLAYRLTYEREGDEKARSERLNSREDVQNALAFLLLLSNLQSGIRPLVHLHKDG